MCREPLNQGLSKDFETGKIFGCPIFQGRPQNTQIATINMYLLIEIRHDILIQCHGNFIELRKSNYMLEIYILRNFSQTILGVLRGDF